MLRVADKELFFGSTGGCLEEEVRLDDWIDEDYYG